MTKLPNREPPHRVAARPHPSQWDPAELMSFREAAALFWPQGPLTVSSLRTAHKDKKLAAVEIAGKFLTTKSAILQMSTCSLETNEPIPEPVTASPETPRAKASRNLSDFRQRIRLKTSLSRRSVCD
jgi:hypothetical protein